MRPGIIRFLVEPDPGDIPAAGHLEPQPEVCAFGSLDSDRAGRRPVLPDAARARGPAVVKFHEYGPLIGVPEAFCAPDTVAV